MKPIEEIIKESLDELVKVANKEIHQKSKLIFPKYSNGTVRISEQEARFLFIENIVKDYDGFYSVETPTKYKYQFSKDGKKILKPLIPAEKGKSGSIDVCLYDEDKNPKYFVEFKAHISKQSEINKDFFKLKHENDETKFSNYFVHVLERYNKGTIDGLIKRYKEAFELKVNKGFIEKDIIVFVCMLKIPKRYKCDNIVSFNSGNCEKTLMNFLNQ